MRVELFAGFYSLLTTKAKLAYAQTTLLFNANNFLKSISAHRNIAFLSIKFNSSLLTLLSYLFYIRKHIRQAFDVAAGYGNAARTDELKHANASLKFVKHFLCFGVKTSFF